MFCKLKIPAVFIVTVIYSAVCSAQDLSRRLPTEVEALRGELLLNNRWDFSQQWLSSDRGQTLICNYGDSLLAETVEGRRHWYGLQQDSIIYIGEEDRLTVINLDSTVIIARRTPDGDFSGVVTEFSASGTGGGRRFSIIENGIIDFSSSELAGTLIIAPGDTLHNVRAVRERRAFTATFPDDSAAVSTSAVIETYRWYDGDGLRTLLPVAVQRAVYPSVNGALPAKDAEPTFALTFLPDRSEFIVKDRDNSEGQADPEQPDPEALAGALAGATLQCDGRMVTVAVEMPEAGLTVTVDIMDAAGHLYLHESAVSSGECDEISLDCNSLRSGEYIAAIGVDGIDVSPEKRLVIIR